jgi:hypothetical protein
MALMPFKTGVRLRGGSDGGRVATQAASRGVELGGAGSGGRRWRRGRARVEPEVRDDTWGPSVSQARRGQRRRDWRRLPVSEAAIRQGTTGARSAGPRGRDGPAQRLRPSGEGGGGRPVEKKRRWAVTGPKDRMGQKRRKNSFPNKI